MTSATEVDDIEFQKANMKTSGDTLVRMNFTDDMEEKKEIYNDLV